ncbi:MAG: tRNA (adenosine(37)-N6)-threonylcarbamoyltransferase complex transferase subunit TsaD [Patescibacteria group bacterium]|jgi:N6-L-threonylcarbamoyladenine synthase
MNNKNTKIRILAIETSCDETAAAVIEEQLDGSRIKSGMTGLRPVILSNIISSQIDLHAQTGGVVPEVASRAHMEAIIPVISQALLLGREVGPADYQEAIEELSGITHIAVTAGPGLIGSLLVGFNAAKTMAYARGLPIIPINHIEGHIYSAFSRELSSADDQFPILALTVSGGHTSLTLMKDHGIYETLGQTLDDAVGEAYDKVAKLLGLGYPGGPAISKLACEFRRLGAGSRESGEETPNFKLQTPNSIVFPRPVMNDGTYNFSFSGLKTSVLQKTKDIVLELNLNSPTEIPDEIKQEIAYAFEEAVAEVLATKTARAVKEFQPKTVVFAGGVSANQYLASQIQLKVESIKSKDKTIQFLTPPRDMTGDNAAMIGLAAYHHIKQGKISNWDEIDVDSNWELT